MDTPLPPGFQSLTHVLGSQIHSLHSVIGIVVDVAQPTRTRTGEFMITFKIQDKDLIKQYSSPDGLKVRCFTPFENQIIQVKACGDVVLLRDLKWMSVYGADKMLVSNRHSTSVVFPVDSIPAEAYKLAYLEQMYAVHLKDKLSGQIAVAPHVTSGQTADTGLCKSAIAEPSKLPATTYGPKLRKTSSIRDLAYNTFYNLSVEVIKIFPGQYADLELYVTDYTSNDLLYDYPHPEEKDDGTGLDGDPFGYMPVARKEWPGPHGQMTLKIEVKEPHASFVKHNVREGQRVTLENVRVKQSNQNKMEANLFPDNKFHDKILVKPVSSYTPSAPIRELLERKEKYWSSMKKRRPSLGDGEGQLPLKKQKKKQSKQEKKTRNEANKAIKSGTESSTEMYNPFTTSNKHVRCAYEDVNQSTLSEILHTNRIYKGPSGITQSLPFINQKRRAFIRVVDFFPSLEEFARPVESRSHTPSSLSIDYSLSQQWEWDFFLLIEDARPSLALADQHIPQIWLHVDHKSAEYLLRLDACDLSHDQKALAQLREKLAILWGNLEERKLAALTAQQPYPPHPTNKSNDEAQMSPRDNELSNLPFTCCMKEYGQPVDKEDLEEYPSGYIQVYNLFGTTIL
ncbi:hypothetical protein MBLNU459_g2924t1 [Dothideomycetes sp. NU459]